MTEPTTKREIDDDILAIREMLAQEQTPPLTSRRAEWGEVTQRAGAQPTLEELAAISRAPRPPRGRAPAPVPDAPGLSDLPMLAAAEDDLPEPQARGGKARRRLKAPRLPQAGKNKSGGVLSRRALPDVAALRGYRPKRAHLLAALAVLFILWRPWLAVALVILPPLVLLGMLAGLGHERFWDGAMRGFKWYARRRPVRAERLRRRLDAFAMRWDRVLDRFPEGLVDGLYLPDFDSLAEREAQHERALDARMDRLRREAGAGAPRGDAA